MKKIKAVTIVTALVFYVWFLTDRSEAAGCVLQETFLSFRGKKGFLAFKERRPEEVSSGLLCLIGESKGRSGVTAKAGARGW